MSQDTERARSAVGYASPKPEAPSAKPGSGRGSSRRRLTVSLWRSLIVVGFLAVWEGIAYFRLINELFISRPTRVFPRIGEMLADPAIYYDLYLTMYEAFIAFGLGAVVGLVGGYAISINETVLDICRPLLEILNAIPKIVFAPLFILWFGLGPASKIALGFSLTVFIVFFNVHAGLENVDRSLVRKARVMGASRWQINRYVLFPSVMAWFLGSLRTSFGFALVGVIVGEYLSSARGLGHVIAEAEATFNTTTVFAGLIILSAVVLLVSLVLARVERYVLRWRPRETVQAAGP